jgi:hypothetical protein
MQQASLKQFKIVQNPANIRETTTYAFERRTKNF